MAFNTQQSARDAYLESQVLTATPHKQHLMLIEGALRKAHSASQELQAGEMTMAATHLARCGQIAAELAVCFQSDDDDLNKKVRTVYIFIVNQVREAMETMQPAAVEKIVRVLSVEADTWRMVCAGSAEHNKPSTPAPHMPIQSNSFSDESSEGFSLEA